MKPVMDPAIPMLVIHPPAVALSLVGNSSVRCDAIDGASIVAPNVAMKIEAARNQPLSMT